MKKLFTVVPLLLIILFMISQVWAGTVGPVNPTIQIYSGDLTHPATAAISMETLFVSIDGLQPLARYNIKILTKNSILIAEYALNATVDGKLPTTPMWAEAGLPPVGRNGGPANPLVDLQLGTYLIVLAGPNVNLTFPFTVVQYTPPVIWSSDVAGQSVNGFRNGVDTVYVTGVGFPYRKTVNVYIMPDKDNWLYGDILNNPQLYFKTATALTTSTGKLGPVNLGVAAFDKLHGNCANFDIVVDANQNGVFDYGDAVDHKYAAGYTVQIPPDPANLKLQLASNGHSVDYTQGYNAIFYYPDTINHDGSDTGFPYGNFGNGVFCILNPLIDSTNPTTQLVEGNSVQIWVITLSDFNNLASTGYMLNGKDVSDPLGWPDLVTVQRTCGNGCGSTLIWSAPLVDKRGYNPYVPGTGYVVIVEKPNAAGQFDNLYNPNADYVDGVLCSGVIPAYQGFSVVDP